MFSKELKIKRIEARIEKLAINRAINQNIINKNMRTLRKLKSEA